VKKAGRTLALAAALGLGACGYHFPGQGRTLPGGATSLQVGKFRNQTGRPGLGEKVRDALEQEVLRRGVFPIERQATGADLVLEGAVERFETRPVAFSPTDQAVRYETFLTVSAQLRDPRSDKVVWRIGSLRRSDSFGSVAETVVAQSSTFQERATIDAGDLAQLSDVQVSESQRSDALERVLENVTRDLYNAMVEDF